MALNHYFIDCSSLPSKEAKIAGNFIEKWSEVSDRLSNPNTYDAFFNEDINPATCLELSGCTIEHLQ